MASAGLHKRSRNRFCGDVDALAAQVSAIAVAKGRSFCKWPDESETLGEAALHVDKVEPEHDLLLVLKRAQDNLCFSRKQVETVVEKVITESKWKLAAADKEDMIKIMARRIRNMCRAVHQAELKSSSRHPPTWIQHLPWHRAEDEREEEDGAWQRNRKIRAKSLPRVGNADAAEQTAIKDARGRTMRRCQAKTAEGVPTYAYGWDSEAFRAWRVSSASRSGLKELSEPLQVLAGAAPDDFMVGQWRDGDQHEIAITVEAFKLQTERRVSGECRSILWSEEHDRTHHSLKVCQKTDRALLCYIAEQSRQICQARMDLFGEVPDQWSLLPLDNPTLLAAKSFMVKIAMRYKTDELDLKSIKAARDAELKSLGLYSQKKPLPTKLGECVLTRKRPAAVDATEAFVWQPRDKASSSTCAGAVPVTVLAPPHQPLPSPLLPHDAAQTTHVAFIDADFPPFGDEDAWLAMA